MARRSRTQGRECNSPILWLLSTRLPSTHDISDLRRLQYIAPVTRDGLNFALLHQDMIEISEYGEKLSLTLHIARIWKNKWDLTQKFYIARFKDQTFTITFRRILEYHKLML